MSFFSKIFSKEKKEDLDKGLEKTKDSFLIYTENLNISDSPKTIVPVSL